MAACAALFVCGGTAMAQEADKDMPDRSEKHYKPVPLSPEKSARQTTDRMDSLLNLTKKQYDKLYKLNLKWARKDAENKTAAPRPKAWTVVPRKDGRTGGVGLANLRQRLQLLYGDGFTLDITEKDGKTYHVNLIIPCEYDTDTMHSR